jgi:DNA gyrase subunit A
MTLESPDDEVVSLDIVDETTTLLTVTENGFGKRTEYSEYPVHHRGGKGVITIVTNARNGPVSRVRSVAEHDELIFTSSEGIIIRVPVKDIPIQGRNTQGVRIMNIKSGDKVAGIARIKNGKAEEELKMTALKAQRIGKTDESSEDEAETLEYVRDIEDLEDTIEDVEYAEKSERIEEAQDEIEREFEEEEEEEEEDEKSE